MNRNTQFTRIAEWKAAYEAQGNPVVSVDTQKKEPIGQMVREGALYTTETLEVLDHDFPSLADGVAIPHAVYDIARNEAYVSMGARHDTAELACDSIRHWWTNDGKLYVAYATSIFFNVDGWRWQQLVQALHFQTRMTGFGG